MTEALFYVAALVTAISALAAQGLIAVAREHVREHHPRWFEALTAPGSRWRLGGPDQRARRRLMKPLVLGAMPPEASGDATLAMLARRVRFAMAGVAVGFGALATAIVLRAPAV